MMKLEENTIRPLEVWSHFFSLYTVSSWIKLRNFHESNILTLFKLTVIKIKWLAFAMTFQHLQTLIFNDWTGSF